MKNKALQIDLIYDIICPWCYIGHQRLLNAIKQTNKSVDIRLVSFQIRPHLPEEGISIEEYWQQKGVTNPSKAYERVSEAAEQENLGFDVSKFSKIPNTLKIHQLILKAEENGVGVQLLHAIQTAYFKEGVDLTVPANFIKIAQEFLTEMEINEALSSKSKYSLKVKEYQEFVTKQHIKAVPAYIVNQQHKIFGAVTTYKLKDMLVQLAPEITSADFCDIETGIC